jgi:hypothetical protein
MKTPLLILLGLVLAAPAGAQNNPNGTTSGMALGRMDPGAAKAQLAIKDMLDQLETEEQDGAAYSQSLRDQITTSKQSQVASELNKSANSNYNIGIASAFPNNNPSAGSPMFNDLTSYWNNIQSSYLPTIRTQMKSYPRIQISVQPTPPIDYTIIINDRREGPEKSIFVVPMGDVTVIVQRTGKPPCSWTGRLGARERHTLACTL